MNEKSLAVAATLTNESWFYRLAAWCENEFCPENPKFLHAVRLVNITLGTPVFPNACFPARVNKPADRLAWIKKTFIAEDGPLTINIDFQKRQALLDTADKNLTRTSFDAAYLEILDLVGADTYPRMKRALTEGELEKLDEVVAEFRVSAAGLAVADAKNLKRRGAVVE